MLRNQSALPRLPVPPLEDCVSGFLDAAGPVLRDDAATWARTQAAAAALLGEEGRELQRRLERRRGEEDNWLEKWWLDGYVTDRGPIPTHISPVFLWGPDPAGCMTQAGRAAKLVAAAVRMHFAIEAGELPVDTLRGQPLCMNEYRNQFASTRVPGVERDALVSSRGRRPTHAAVLTGGRVYAVDVCAGAAPRPLPEVAAALRACIDDAAAKGPPPRRPAVLTSWRRAEWAAARQRIAASAAGAAALERVEGALFCVALDTRAPAPEGGDTAKQFMHGLGGDRWFDKSFNIIVCPNGVAGVVFEHSGTDALPYLKYADRAFADATPAVSEDGAAALRGRVEEVVIPLDDVADDVARAEAHFREQAGGVDCEWISDPACGAQQLRALPGRPSPDAFIQLALQLAWRRARGMPTPSTYEAGSMKQCLHGRTETVRPVTPESLAFVDRFCDPAAPPAARAAAFAAAAAAHGRRLRRVKEGRGVDRHLLGLRMLAADAGRRGGLRSPALFSDPGFARFANIDLSTSNPQGSEQPEGVLTAIFGPVSPTGVGACYLTHQRRLVAAITTFDRTAARFAAALRGALSDMRGALTAAPPPPQSGPQRGAGTAARL